MPRRHATKPRAHDAQPKSRDDPHDDRMASSALPVQLERSSEVQPSWRSDDVKLAVSPVSSSSSQSTRSTSAAPSDDDRLPSMLSRTAESAVRSSPVTTTTTTTTPIDRAALGHVTRNNKTKDENDHRNALVLSAKDSHVRSHPHHPPQSHSKHVHSQSQSTASASSASSVSSSQTQPQLPASSSTSPSPPPPPPQSMSFLSNLSQYVPSIDTIKTFPSAYLPSMPNVSSSLSSIAASASRLLPGASPDNASDATDGSNSHRLRLLPRVVIWRSIEHALTDAHTNDTDDAISQSYSDDPLCFRLYLLLGLVDGFQIYRIYAADDVRLLLSVRDGPIACLRLLPVAVQESDSGDESEDSDAGAAWSRMHDQRVAVASADERPDFPSSVIKVFSMQYQEYKAILRFGSAVHSIVVGPTVMAVCLASEVHVFEAQSLQFLFKTSCYPNPPGHGLVTLGARWMAYATAEAPPSPSLRSSYSPLLTASSPSPSLAAGKVAGPLGLPPPLSLTPLVSSLSQSSQGGGGAPVPSLSGTAGGTPTQSAGAAGGSGLGTLFSAAASLYGNYAPTSHAASITTPLTLTNMSHVSKDWASGLYTLAEIGRKKVVSTVTAVSSVLPHMLPGMQSAATVDTVSGISGSSTTPGSRGIGTSGTSLYAAVASLGSTSSQPDSSTTAGLHVHTAGSSPLFAPSAPPGGVGGTGIGSAGGAGALTSASGAQAAGAGAAPGTGAGAAGAGAVVVRDLKRHDMKIVHFQAHNSPLSVLQFDSSGMLLASVSETGQFVHVHQIVSVVNNYQHSHDAAVAVIANTAPSSSASSSGGNNSSTVARASSTGTNLASSPGAAKSQHRAPHMPALYVTRQLYRLHRGVTHAVVRSLSFSCDSKLLAVSSEHGTTHIFAINPQGGPVDARTHGYIDRAAHAMYPNTWRAADPSARAGDAGSSGLAEPSPFGSGVSASGSASNARNTGTLLSSNTALSSFVHPFEAPELTMMDAIVRIKPEPPAQMALAASMVAASSARGANPAAVTGPAASSDVSPVLTVESGFTALAAAFHPFPLRVSDAAITAPGSSLADANATAAARDSVSFSVPAFDPAGGASSAAVASMLQPQSHTRLFDQLFVMGGRGECLWSFQLASRHLVDPATSTPGAASSLPASTSSAGMGGAAFNLQSASASAASAGATATGSSSSALSAAASSASAAVSGAASYLGWIWRSGMGGGSTAGGATSATYGTGDQLSMDVVPLKAWDFSAVRQCPSFPALRSIPADAMVKTPTATSPPPRMQANIELKTYEAGSLNVPIWGRPLFTLQKYKTTGAESVPGSSDDRSSLNEMIVEDGDAEVLRYNKYLHFQGLARARGDDDQYGDIAVAAASAHGTTQPDAFDPFSGASGAVDANDTSPAYARDLIEDIGGALGSDLPDMPPSAAAPSFVTQPTPSVAPAAKSVRIAGASSAVISSYYGTPAAAASSSISDSSAKEQRAVLRGDVRSLDAQTSVADHFKPGPSPAKASRLPVAELLRGSSGSAGGSDSPAAATDTPRGLGPQTAYEFDFLGTRADAGTPSRVSASSAADSSDDLVAVPIPAPEASGLAVIGSAVGNAMGSLLSIMPSSFMRHGSNESATSANGSTESSGVVLISGSMSQFVEHFPAPTEPAAAATAGPTSVLSAAGRPTSNEESKVAEAAASLSTPAALPSTPSPPPSASKSRQVLSKAASTKASLSSSPNGVRPRPEPDGSAAAATAASSSSTSNSSASKAKPHVASGRGGKARRH